ncbi:MAG: hypothetical protein ACJ788_22110 [Ktedonobacteraceae bacterium]|jgi:hypothetical protein
MDNQPDPNQPAWNPQPQPSFPEGQPQWAQPQQPPQYNQSAWYQPPATNYISPQYGQNMPGQYNIPSYAQVQPQQQQTNNFFVRWLMMGIALRIVILVVIPLLLCGGCALLALFSSVLSH